MMLKEESKKQLITRATQYGVDPAMNQLQLRTLALKRLLANQVMSPRVSLPSYHPPIPRVLRIQVRAETI